ncbi:tetraspanin family protein [Oceanospirillum sediminis]|uniref:Tetraspanin family protein n=1 Tax=Oceanospirillum sediminis TaxID=2760088 RepID=A0A839IQG5_9GAMM|nr:tetraspanin family protein [Oceanospirillum sediminis]MBB1487171.1 tetraspanin family protein [Oceanospirillum sediminis]
MFSQGFSVRYSSVQWDGSICNHDSVYCQGAIAPRDVISQFRRYSLWLSLFILLSITLFCRVAQAQAQTSPLNPAQAPVSIQAQSLTAEQAQAAKHSQALTDQHPVAGKYISTHSGQGFAHSGNQPMRQADNRIFQGKAYAACVVVLDRVNETGFTLVRRFGQLTQQQIEIIYRDNLDYLQDRNKPGHYLSDGIFGFVTGKWLAYFCSEFGMDTQVDTDAFIIDLLTALSQIAELSQLYPFWRERITPYNLLHWSTERSQPVLDGYQQNQLTSAQPNIAYYYRLTVDDMAYLAERNAILKQLDGLIGQQFTSRLEANNAVRPILKQLTERYELLLNQVIEAEPAAEPQAKTRTTGTAKTETTTTVTTTTGEGEEQKTQSHTQTANSTQTSESLAAPEAASVYSMTQNSVRQLLLDLGIVSLDKKTLKQLKVLQDQVFAQQYQLNVALKLAGLSYLSQAMRHSIAEQAFKLGVPLNNARPMVWQATEGCGCSDNQFQTNGNRNFFYGFYPYWTVLEDGEGIDFSQLSRIGYFSAAIVPEINDQGNPVAELKLPQNWQKTRPYADFIYKAHKHKVKVDLVVTSPRNYTDNAPVKGIRGSGASDSGQQASINNFYGEGLINRIVSTVKVPLDNYWINRAKPVMSFGFSPMRTMADGVTLDLDLSQMNSKSEQEAFKTFITELKQKLSANDKQRSMGEKVKANNQDEYFLNIMVPVSQLIAGQGFFTLSNLRSIAPYINLFILVADQPDQNDQAFRVQGISDIEGDTSDSKNGGASQADDTSQNSGANPGEGITRNNELDLIRDFRRFLSQQSQDEMAWLFSKMVPILLTQDNKNTHALLNELVGYSRWSFSGAAYWTLPLITSDYTIISNAYFPKEEAEGIPGLISQVATSTCDILCPQRWTLRALLFLLFITVVACVISTLWFYRLRSLVKSWYFAIFIVVLSVFIMLVFNCDPYWRERQPLIFFIFILVLLITGAIIQLHKSREGRYP